MEVIYTTTEAARDTLALIRYKVEGNDEKFKETALTISGKLDLEGRCDAALFIRAQYNEIPTFIPMNDGYVRPSKDAYYLGIAKAVARRATRRTELLRYREMLPPSASSTARADGGKMRIGARRRECNHIGQPPGNAGRYPVPLGHGRRDQERAAEPGTVLTVLAAYP